VKLRHTAALVLVGWYLMLPPLRLEGPASDPNTPVEVDTQAPLSAWKIVHRFDTAKECYNYPDHIRKILREREPNPNSKEAKGEDAMAKYWFDRAQCVATDDPRVAGMKPPAK
jgi:hypothetical protein